MKRVDIALYADAREVFFFLCLGVTTFTLLKATDNLRELAAANRQVPVASSAFEMPPTRRAAGTPARDVLEAAPAPHEAVVAPPADALRVFRMPYDNPNGEADGGPISEPRLNDSSDPSPPSEAAPQ